jgi:hypothetical protein
MAASRSPGTLLALAAGVGLLLAGCVNITPQGGTSSTTTSAGGGDYAANLQRVLAGLPPVLGAVRDALATHDNATIAATYHEQMIPLLEMRANESAVSPPPEWIRAHLALNQWFNATVNEYSAGALCYGGGPPFSCVMLQRYDAAAGDLWKQWQQAWPGKGA